MPLLYILQQLDALDKKIFYAINTQMANPVFDVVMPWLRHANNWAFLYIFILLLAIKYYKKKVWFWVLFAVLTIVLTDQTSSHIFKPLFQRLRPCADVLFSSKVMLRVHHCSGGYSFTSSHATNHFGIAIFFVGSLWAYLKPYRWLFYIWAASIAMAQVYVGVHYPFDVLCGALLGICLGKLSVHFFSKIYTQKIVGLGTKK